MDEKDCLILKYISREGNLTKAAERLYFTPSALTYRIREMEKKLGVKIFVKKGRNIEITSEGEYLVDCAVEQLRRWSNIKNNILNMSGQIRGKLKIGVSRITATEKLPLILKEFNEKYPNVNTEIYTGYSDEIYELLQRGDVQIGLVRGDYIWSETKYFINRENICLISKENIDIDHLPDLPRIQYRTSTYLNHLINDWWYERFDKPPLISMEINDYIACKEMVKNGLGYAVVPKIFLNEEDDLYSTNLFYKDEKEIILDTWVLVRKSSLKLMLVNEFINHVEAFYK